MPEVAIDAHEYGAVPTVYNGKYIYASYDLLISASTNKNLSSTLLNKSRSLYLNSVHNTLGSYGIRSMDYYDGSISSTITEMNPMMMMNANANALYPSFSFLVESLIPGGGYNSAIHLKRRVKSQLITAKTIIEITSNNSIEVKKVIDNERSNLLNKSKVYGDDDLIILNQAYKEKPIDFEYIDLESNELKTVSAMFRSYYDGEVTDSVSRPLAYILPKTEAIAIAVTRLKKIGVEVNELTSYEIPKGLQKYVVKSNKVATSLNQGVYINTLDVSVEDCADVSFNSGAYYISMDQKMSNLIALALEPEYEGSFASYRIIDVANISVGSSLPYYRYVGIKEKTKVSIEVSNKEYDGNPIDISISGSPSYKIEWYSNGVKLNATPKDAGLYKAIVTVYEDSDYLGFVRELIVSIEKATPNISVSYIGDALTTQSIKPDASMFEVIGMDGTLELDVPDLKEGNITVSYKFIPADRINYNEVKGTIKLKVTSLQQNEVNNGCAGSLTTSLIGLISLTSILIYIKKKKENW